MTTARFSRRMGEQCSAMRDARYAAALSHEETKELIWLWCEVAVVVITIGSVGAVIAGWI